MWSVCVPTCEELEVVVLNHVNLVTETLMDVETLRHCQMNMPKGMA